MDEVNILGLDFNNLTFKEFEDELIHRINEHTSTMIVTANPEIVMAANENPKFMELIHHSADLVSADGTGIVLAGKILKTPIKERVTGYDLFKWLIEFANSQKLRIYLIGAKPEVIALVQAKIQKEFPGISLVGAEDGYFKDDLATVAKRIEKTSPDMVFTAIGYPRQEELIAIMRSDNLPAVMMGIGGSFDVFSGQVKRAPEVFQKTHLEWFYRLLKDPSRFKRMGALPKFVFEVEKEKKHKH